MKKILTAAAWITGGAIGGALVVAYYFEDLQDEHEKEMKDPWSH